MSLTKQEIKNYLKANGMRCPKKECRSDCLTTHEPTFDCGDFLQPVTCVSCGLTWIDEYKLKGIRNIEDEGGDEDERN